MIMNLSRWPAPPAPQPGQPFPPHFPMPGALYTYNPYYGYPIFAPPTLGSQNPQVTANGPSASINAVSPYEGQQTENDFESGNVHRKGQAPQDHRKAPYFHHSSLPPKPIMAAAERVSPTSSSPRKAATSQRSTSPSESSLPPRLNAASEKDISTGEERNTSIPATSTRTHQLRIGIKRERSTSPPSPSSTAVNHDRPLPSPLDPGFQDVAPIVNLPFPSKRFKKDPHVKHLLIPAELLPVYPLPPLPPVTDNTLEEKVFTHISLFPKSQGRFEEVNGGVAGHYEKLEHVGDSILGMVVTAWLHETKPELTCGTATVSRLDCRLQIDQ